MTTTRETADPTSLQKMQTSPDHIGEANEKIADHIGDATTMIDHAELARLAEAATLGKWQNGIDDCEGVVALAEHTGNVICLPPTDDMQASLEFWPRNAAFIAAANPARVIALLSEIAALRGELAQSKREYRDDVGKHIARATQAKRQRDEARDTIASTVAKADWMQGRLSGERASIDRETIELVVSECRAYCHLQAIANQGADQ